MFTILSQQILSDKLLLVVIGRQKNKVSGGFKLELIIYNLKFIVKML